MKSPVLKKVVRNHRQTAKTSVNQSGGFADNRPAANIQRKLQQSADNSQQVQTAAQLQKSADTAAIQLMGGQEEEELQGKFKTVHKMDGLEEEEALQGKFVATQLAGDLEEEEPLQGKFQGSSNSESTFQLEEKTANKTGLPDNLKSGIESLSGMDISDTRVHYNSSKPSQLNAHAYAQGSDIHVASGQEKHLPHEAWHVVQQRQGRVKPTTTVSGVGVNDDVSLEKEADVMGAKALQRVSVPFVNGSVTQKKAHGNSPDKAVSRKVVQLKWETKDKVKYTESEDFSTYNSSTKEYWGGGFGANWQKKTLSEEEHKDIMVLIQRDQEATEGTDASTYTFADDQTYAIIRDVENKIVVGIDHHQNKHQHPKTMIAEIGTWTKKKGTLFKKGRGLDWHRRNTAETIKAWALEQIPLTGRVTLKKKPLSDGYIYDASVQPDEGLAIVTYHCNPLQNE